MSVLTFKDYYKSRERHFPISNILSVENPDAYECEVTAFRRTHTRLTVHCYSTDAANTVPGFKLEFEVATYIELYPMWDGINLSVAPPDECAALLSQSKFGIRPISDEVLEKNMLFVVDSTKRALKVISTRLAAYPLFSKDDYLNSLK